MTASATRATDGESTHLLGWIARPPTRTGIYRAEAVGWHLATYEELAVRARGHACDLSRRGVTRGDVVSIVASSADDFVSRFFGVLSAGATPNPIPPPLPMQDAACYRRHVARLLAVARPAIASVEPGLHELLSEVMSSYGAPMIGDLPMDGPTSADLSGCASADIGLLQFTSGSSGQPKAVRVPVASLEANISAIHSWTECTASDRVATWLPPYHDMGLIGCLLAPVLAGIDIDAMTPIDFIKDPHKWIACFGERNATFSAAPNFALSYVLSKVDENTIAKMNFRTWRMLIVGAERLDAKVLRAFAQRLGPSEFRPETLCPAYGLAEATLAVSGVKRGEAVRVACLDPGASTTAGPLDLMSAPLNDGRTWLVGCGRPLSSVTVRAGGPAVVSELYVGGPSVAQDYVAADGICPLERDHQGYLATGDAGLIVDGEIYPIGRVGDSVKIRGIAVYAEDLEATIMQAVGISANHVAALTGIADGAAHVGILFEEVDVDVNRVRTLLAATVGTDARLALFNAPRGTIERTTSGKSRRRTMWKRMLDGAYARHTIADSRYRITVDPLNGPEIAAFLQEHLDEMRSISPPESKHALDLDGLRDPDVTFWRISDGEQLIGCGALKDLGDGQAEIKSMRTSRLHKQRGIASILLQHMIDYATRRGFDRINLETGSQDFFAPARGLYTKYGFQTCDPFANYREDQNSVFMTRSLEVDR